MQYVVFAIPTYFRSSYHLPCLSKDREKKTVSIAISRTSAYWYTTCLASGIINHAPLINALLRHWQCGPKFRILPLYYKLHTVYRLTLLVSKHWPRQLPIVTAPVCFNTGDFFLVFDLGGLAPRTRMFWSPDLGFRDQFRGHHQAIRRYNAWATAHHSFWPWCVGAKSASAATQEPAFVKPSKAYSVRWEAKCSCTCMHVVKDPCMDGMITAYSIQRTLQAHG